jgi:integrase
MPKRVGPLSPKKLAAVRPGAVPVELGDGHVRGLRVRVYPSGARVWSLSVRDANGTRRRFDVGTDLGLAEARRKAEELRRSIREGADPTSERRAARQRTQAARAGVGTLGALFEVYYTNGPGKEQRRADESLTMLRAVFAGLLDKPALDIKRVELQRTADAWRSATSASLAVRLVRPVLKWAEKREQVGQGVSDLEVVATVRKRDRVISREEIKAIWPHLRGSHGSVMRWLMRTGCRLNEAASMTWGEISGDVWTIPKERAKGKRTRTIPLPRQALDALGEAGDMSALVFPSTRGGAIANWNRETKRLQKASGTSGWHRHDIRRTVATMLGDLGFAPHVIGIVLGHKDVAAGATAIYARSRYQQEHRQALQALADEIDRVVSDERKIVRLAAVR